MKHFWKEFCIALMVSLFTSIYIWRFATVKISPILDAVPFANWKGIPNSLIAMSEIVIKYKFLPFILPLFITIIDLIILKNKNIKTPDNKSKLARLITIFSILFLLIIACWIETGKPGILDQMTASMGLGD